MSDEGKGSEMEDFASMLEEQLGSYRSGFSPGEHVKAVVLSVGAVYVVLDVKAKHEGLLPVEEFKDEEGQISVQPGQSLDVIFVAMRDGAFVFTTRETGRVAIDQTIAQARASGRPIEGTVQGEVNGGYEVTVAGRRAFCPYSQISLYRQDATTFIGKKFAFIVQEDDEGGRNLVVSRRALLEEERAAQRERLMEELQPGQTRDGVVTRLMDFGFFVDLGGVEGLVPLKEMSWKRDLKPSDVVKEGDAVQVTIREIDWERDRLSLSLRATQEDPFSGAVASCPVGSSLRGSVTHLESFGAFVELVPGVEGLVPIGKLGGGQRIAHPKEVVAVGQELDVQVESIDFDRRRIGLRVIDARVAGLKPGRLDVGSIVEGIVESVKDFGVFVRLSDSQTGLLHASETDVAKGGNSAARLEKAFPPGTTISVVVKQNDGKRVGLTLPAKWEKDGGDTAKDTAEYLQNRTAPGSLGSLGDAFSKLKL